MARDVPLTAPHFDDLRHGQVFESAPAMTLTVGHAAVHQSIVGDRMLLALDHDLAAEVTGRAPFAHPALVWDIAIGQSTIVTQRVVANLFYRGLVFHRTPALGDSLRTRTTVVALRENRRRPERRSTGLAVLRITTTDQHNETVLDYWRCAMLPLSSDSVDTGHADNVDRSIPLERPATATATATAGWDLAPFRARVSTSFDPSMVGATQDVLGGDVVSGAAELCRLTLNIAMAHHDVDAASPRLVYGGHTVGIACAQACRAFPNIVTIVAWRSCDHTGAVYEGETLRSRVSIEDASRRADGAYEVGLRSMVTAQRGPAEVGRKVLDWRFTAVMT